jgi:hypothetical protein
MASITSTDFASDHKMVFQLGDALNKLNGNASDLAVKFIPWIQSSPNVPVSSNGYRLPNGRIPSRAQLTAANVSSIYPAAVGPNATAAVEAATAAEELVDLSPARAKAAAQNVYKAHKEAIARGLFQYSEATFLKYALGLDANLTDFVAGSGSAPLWGEIYDNVYFAGKSNYCNTIKMQNR